MPKTELSSRAAKFLKRLPPKHRRQVATKIKELEDDPVPNDSIQMKGSASRFRRADIGEYRVIYRQEGESLRIALVGKRNDGAVYRQFKRGLR